MNQREQNQDNIVTVDLITNKTTTGRLNLSNETIKASATILANNFLDYVRNDGDMENLTPSRVFERKQ